MSCRPWRGGRTEEEGFGMHRAAAADDDGKKRGERGVEAGSWQGTCDHRDAAQLAPHLPSTTLRALSPPLTLCWILYGRSLESRSHPRCHADRSRLAGCRIRCQVDQVGHQDEWGTSRGIQDHGDCVQGSHCGGARGHFAANGCDRHPKGNQGQRFSADQGYQQGEDPAGLVRPLAPFPFPHARQLFFWHFAPTFCMGMRLGREAETGEGWERMGEEGGSADYPAASISGGL
jgi:hypothetical protein